MLDCAKLRDCGKVYYCVTMFVLIDLTQVEKFLVDQRGEIAFVFVFIYLPHDYNNYKEMPKKKM